MTTRRRAIKIYGLPVQFVVVVVVSLAVTVFFGGWAADASVEARADRLAVVGVPSVLVGDNVRTASLSRTSAQQTPAGERSLEEIEKQWWESAALLVCPLH